MLRSLEVPVGLFEPQSEPIEVVNWLRHQAAKGSSQKLSAGDLFESVKSERLAGLECWSQMLNAAADKPKCDRSE